MLSRLIAFTFGLLACQVSIWSQGTVDERRQAAVEHLKRTAADISARCLTNVTSLEDWDKRRPLLRSQLLEMLGLASPPDRTPLRSQVTGILQRDRYRIEKLVFQSMPGLYVTGNFYIPSEGQGPWPAVLYLCGHAPDPVGAKVYYQNRAAWFAANGFVCLILDTLEFGEVPGLHHGTHDLNMWHWLSLGYTPAGAEVWNGIRALDYLQTRPEVDPKRIGVTGISGGGAITWYLSAVDERVRAAAPVCSTYTFGSQAIHWRAFGQCDCIYFHNTYELDLPIAAALIASRPLLIISGRKDGDFPPDGYHEVFRRSRKVFDLFGAADHLRELDDEVGHSDPPQFLRAARQWMRHWLQNDPTPLPEQSDEFQPEKPEDLACLTGLPEDAINDVIHNRLTQPVSIQAPKSREGWGQRRREILAQLDEKSFRWFPKTPAPFETRVSRNDGGWAARYANYKDVTFQTEPGVRVRAQLLTPKKGPTGAPLLIYAKRAGDSIYFLDLDELLPVLGRHSVLILNPRFTEGSIPANEYRDIQMSAAWCGRTIAAMQLWDVLRAIDWALTDEKLAPGDVTLFGKGEIGIVTLHAALRDPRIQRVVLSDPPRSYWQGPALLNALRISDIPEMAGAFAPRELVVLTPPPISFTVTRAIYEMEQAGESLRQASSLSEALRLLKPR